MDVCSRVTGSCLHSRDAVFFLEEVRLARHLSQAPVNRRPPKFHNHHSSILKLIVAIERHTCPLPNRRRNPNDDDHNMLECRLGYRRLE